MKRFQYGLETVLDYKTQVLDNLRTEHAAALHQVRKKEDEIHRLRSELSGYEGQFDKKKHAGGVIEEYRLFSMCIAQMEKTIDYEKEHLFVLRKKEEEKRARVVEAKIDTSKFEKLKERKWAAYQKAEMKEEENFIEEFVSNGLSRRAENT